MLYPLHALYTHHRDGMLHLSDLRAAVKHRYAHLSDCNALTGDRPPGRGGQWSANQHPDEAYGFPTPRTMMDTHLGPDSIFMHFKVLASVDGR